MSLISFFSFQLEIFFARQNFLQGRSSDDRLPQLFFERVSVSPSYLEGNLARQSILDWQFFSFNTLNVSFDPFLSCKVSVKRKSVVSLMGLLCRL